MLTLKEFDALPNGEVFATGVLPNSRDGIFMTIEGGNLRWVAKKGYGYDWAIYCHWDYNSVEWIAESGDKVHKEQHIQKCVPCEDDVFKLYRF